jgi:hypothetical protein
VRDVHPPLEWPGDRAQRREVGALQRQYPGQQRDRAAPRAIFARPNGRTPPRMDGVR